MKIGLIGGDLRQLTLLNKFIAEGFDASIYGNDEAKQKTDEISEIYKCDIIVFPMPSFSDGLVFSPLFNGKIHISELELPKGKIIFYAGENEEFNKKALESDSKFINYMNREELLIKNAVLTAEGTIQLAINETPGAIFGSRVLICGFGRVAKATARLFSGAGASVTVVARKIKALAEAEALGYEADLIKNIKADLCDFDIIINTIPFLVFDAEMLENINIDTLIIDLASKPGGIDFKSAKEQGKNVIWALSLPGKTAPVTSGEIIFDVIKNILREEEVI